MTATSAWLRVIACRHSDNNARRIAFQLPELELRPSMVLVT
jgi:hypothetical protein